MLKHKFMQRFVRELAAAARGNPARTAAFIDKGLEVLPDVCIQNFKVGCDLVRALADAVQNNPTCGENFINKGFEIMPALGKGGIFDSFLMNALGDVAKNNPDLAALFIHKGFDTMPNVGMTCFHFESFTCAVMDLTKANPVLAAAAIDRGLDVIPALIAGSSELAQGLVYTLLAIAEEDAPSRTTDVVVGGFDVVPSLAARAQDNPKFLDYFYSWEDVPPCNAEYVDAFVRKLHRASADSPDRAAAFVNKGFDVLPAVAAGDGRSACRLLYYLAPISEGNPALNAAFINRGLDVLPNIAVLYPMAASVIVCNLTKKVGLAHDSVVCREFMQTVSLESAVLPVTVVFGDTPEMTRATTGLGCIQGSLSEFKEEAHRQNPPDSLQREEYDRILADVFNVQVTRDSLPSFRELAKASQKKVSLHL